MGSRQRDPGIFNQTDVAQRCTARRKTGTTARGWETFNFRIVKWFRAFTRLTASASDTGII